MINVKNKIKQKIKDIKYRKKLIINSYVKMKEYKQILLNNSNCI